MNSQSFTNFLETIKTLRGPEGCPWDKEQTPSSMRTLLLEEVYETLEAINSNDPQHVREELGDVLLIISMIALMYTEQGEFSLDDVFSSINAKLIRRHPHVFANTVVKDSEEVLRNWERIKVEIEGKSKPHESTLEGIPGSLPPLERSYMLQRKAAKKGFDWPDHQGPISKVMEELEELKLAEDKNHREEELGDLLFSVVNYARHLKIDPAIALFRSNLKFEKRFRHVEKRMNTDGVPLSPENIDIMDAYWEEAKSVQ